MAHVELEGRQYSIQEAVTLLQTTIHNLQTTNGNLQLKLAETQAQLQVVNANAKRGFELVETIPIFNGTAKEDVFSFCYFVEHAAQMAQWSVSDTLAACKQRLANEARIFMISDETAKNATTYNAFKKILVNRFKPKNTERFYREQLSNIKKKDSESIEEFSDRIKSINVKTYELTENADKNEIIKKEADNRALDSFLNGLSGDIAEKTKISDPKTLTQAVQTAVRIHEVLKSATEKEELEPKSILAIQGPEKCARCQKFGHNAANCRSNIILGKNCFICNMSNHWASTCRNKNQNFAYRRGRGRFRARGSRGRGFSSQNQQSNDDQQNTNPNFVQNTNYQYHGRSNFRSGVRFRSNRSRNRGYHNNYPQQTQNDNASNTPPQQNNMQNTQNDQNNPNAQGAY